MTKISTMFAKVCFNTDFVLDIVPKVWYTMVVPKLFGGRFMAKRWSFEEDYIVCRFCRDEYFHAVFEKPEETIKYRLERSGFGSRTIGAVKKRME